MNVTVRAARPTDASALLEIYAPYVEQTAITFEYDVPTEEEFARRISDTLSRYPYLVAQSEEGILGYAYASTFYGRKAYDWCAEVTVYISREHRGQGLGKLLYRKLEALLQAQGILNLYACIAVPPAHVKDEYLTSDSHDFHLHLDYHLAGTFYQCGYKFNRWYDMVWMEKHLDSHLTHQPPVIPFQDIRSRFLL